MTTDKPEYFYKYVTAETAISILCNGSIRYSAPRTFNDPFDAQFNRDDFGRLFPGTEEKWRKVIKKRLLEAVHRIRSGQLEIAEPNKPTMQTLGSLLQKSPPLGADKIVKEMSDEIALCSKAFQFSLPKMLDDTRKLFESFCVFCVSAVRNNLLMWAHYADKHRGVVIKFKSLPDTTKVDYCDTSPFASAPVPDFVDSLLGISSTGRENVEKWIKDLTATKSNAWEYEKEWRIIETFESDAWQALGYKDFPVAPAEIDEVVFGCEMSKENYNKLTLLIEDWYPHAKILESQKDPRKYALDFETIRQGTSPAAK